MQEKKGEPLTEAGEHINLVLALVLTGPPAHALPHQRLVRARRLRRDEDQFLQPAPAQITPGGGAGRRRIAGAHHDKPFVLKCAQQRRITLGEMFRPAKRHVPEGPEIGIGIRNCARQVGPTPRLVRWSLPDLDQPRASRLAPAVAPGSARRPAQPFLAPTEIGRFVPTTHAKVKPHLLCCAPRAGISGLLSALLTDEDACGSA